MASPLLLIVEPQPALARALSRRVAAAGWKTLSASSIDEARTLIDRLTFDAWIFDRDFEPAASRLVREVDQSGRRRPRTAMWAKATGEARDDEPPEPGVATFGELDVDAIVAWLEKPSASKPPSRRPPA